MGAKHKDFNSIITDLLCELAGCIYDSDNYCNIKDQLIEKLEQIDEKTLKLSRIRDRIKYVLIERGRNSYTSYHYPN